MTHAVEIREVTKTFGSHTAVDHLSLDVPKGCIYGFIGPNGSGKTTTLRMIMNIFYPDSGDIRIFGQEQKGASTDRIGYLPEERGLYKRMKLRDVLTFYGRLKSQGDIRKDVDRWLEKMDLAEWADKKVETLSKGMSQKAQFIATVVSRPEMVILDEPFSGLDPVNADVLRDAVVELRKEGTTIVFSTHDMAVAEKMCDSIFMIFKGKKVLDGTLEDIQATYGDDTIRLRFDGDPESLKNLDGVDHSTDFGKMKELRMKEGCDPQDVLRQLIKVGRVLHFELARPSLHDIFVRIAGPEAREVSHA